MTATAHAFIKYIPVTIPAGAGGEPNGPITSNVFTDRIEDVATVGIHYNGQLLPGGLATVTPNSKYYYEFTRTVPALGVDGMPSGSATAAFVIHRNPSYRGPDYDSGNSAVSFLTTDNIVISYYYVVYTLDA